ncbi:neuralized-like protein 4 [Hetaerina americana]|uniref:neuralized-like protein 4 n=1 Tax=Hetaerina americana TaxID=62018 RepID=UPI003A7F3D3F
MAFSFLMLLFQFLIFHKVVREAVADPTCETTSTSSRKLNLVINSRKEADGEWLTTFHASKSDSATNNITLNLTQTAYHCGNEQEVHIKGVIRADRVNGTVHTNERLLFNPKCGTNAGISNDGRSAEKINLEDPLNGVVLTNRPLRRNERLEVRLDKKHNKFSYSIGIGITSNIPESFNIPDHMYNLKSGNWMMYHTSVYINGAEKVKGYGTNFNELKVGDRVGVSVNNLGTLHFFVNGVDQGPAASNIPEVVYGVFELYYNAAKGTIVDPSS